MSDRPALRIVRGTPDDAEIAALTVALAGVAAASTAAPEKPKDFSEWASRSSGLRRTGSQRPLRPGPNAWRASALPQ